MIYTSIENYKYKDLEKFTYAQLEADEIAKRKQYVIVYDPFETNFDCLGLGVLNTCVIDPIITKELNADYSLTMTIYKDNRGKYKRVKPLSIIKAQGQLFRIPFWEGIKDNGLTINVQAKHIFYDLMEAFTEDRRVQGQNIYETMSRLLESDKRARFRIGVTDVTNVGNANFIDENVCSSIMKKVIPRWKAELLRDNFSIVAKKRLGKYKPDLYIRYGQHAKGLRKKVDYTNMCTRIYAKGKEGITIASINNNVKYLDSSKINDYPIVFPVSVKFDDAETPEQLKILAQEYLDKYDKPLITIEVDLQDLFESKDYENLQSAIQLNEGDTVTVYDKDLDIYEEQRVIKIQQHAITGVKVNITLGIMASTIIDSMDDTDNRVTNVEEKVANNTGDNNAIAEALIDIGKEIDNIYLDTNSIGNRVKELEDNKLIAPLICSKNITIVQNRQLVTLPTEFKGRQFTVSAISILQASNLSDIDIYEIDLDAAEGTFYIMSNQINIKIKILIITL